MKNSLPYLKCVLRLPCVVPYMGRDFAQTTQSSRPLVRDVSDESITDKHMKTIEMVLPTVLCSYILLILREYEKGVRFCPVK